MNVEILLIVADPGDVTTMFEPITLPDAVRRTDAVISALRLRDLTFINLGS